MKILYLLSIFILGSVIAKTNTSTTLSGREMQTLKSVHMIFRHGNKQLDEVYEVRTGLLTDLGKNEVFQLGLYIRDRYPSFLKEEFDSNEIEILSSGANRVIQSSNLFAYGLYKSYNLRSNWSVEETLLYQAVPVLSIPKSMDKYLQVTDDCPRRKQLMDDDERELFIEKFLAENEDIVEAYVHNTGDFSPYLPKGQRTSEPIILLFDQIFLNVTKNQTIPIWAEPFLERESLITARYEYFVASINALETQRLHSGNLIQLLTQNMIGSLSSPRKLQVYGAHDFTLMGIMKALELEDKHVHNVPPTASVLFFELHQGLGDKEPYVKILFRNGTNVPPWSRQLPNCKDPCYLSAFAEAVQFLVPQDYPAECQIIPRPTADQSSLDVDEIFYDSNATRSNVIMVTISVIMVVVASMILVLSVFLFQNYRKKIRLYDQV